MSNLVIEFPESLPVSAKREEIMAAMQAHQVIIVCGETGSGKTTQLPKIALAMGRGKLNYPSGRGKLIGHTQPRRIAASSVAKRIAEELKTPLGDVVGFKVRFQDRLSRDASVKLMTDGILLAETQTDPLLKAYDTIIIDEAHERSLNIDFLLGYLRQILPRRPDLKIVVTSATIDAQRFADHFASRPAPGRPKPGDAPSGGSDPQSGGAWGQQLRPAPIIMVSGRMFPVEQRYRPFEESREYDLNSAIADGVDELWRDVHNSGDILVFLPGEREIREAADHLRKHLSHQPVFRNAEVLPLFARLSQAEQDRIFDGHTGRRIVLATNVAETSLTVPGIKYVIDAGTARMKRYSFRSKVEQLLVEPISQSSANQRAGRCGRVANGICIRLYDEKDFAARPRFTDPEILRSSLAGVILRMKSLHLGVVEDFPFIERPSNRAIADGYQLLGELGAVDDANELTAMGQELAKLPLDPRVGRMIVEARSRGALEEVLVIASALSVQDVRDRPMEAQQQADQAHAKFDDEKSEFSGYLKLWKWLEEARGGTPRQAMPGRAAPCPPPALRAPPLPAQHAQTSPASTHKLSNRQYEQLLRQNFVNIRRVREWRDIHSQLHTVVAEHKWRLNTLPASYEQLHLSMLSGFWAISAARSKPKGLRASIWARAPSSFTRTPARIWSKSRAAGLWRRSWLKPRACLAAALPPSSHPGLSRWAATCSKSSCSIRIGRKRPPKSPRWSGPPCMASWSTAAARSTSAGWTWWAHAKSSFARRWWTGNGKPSCRFWRPISSSSSRWKTWSTRPGGRTCWWTTS
jgi:ATP-dependent helicase HrpA